MKIRMTKDRKILAIETDEFTIKLNGKSNKDYTAVLKPLGIHLEFMDELSEEIKDEEGVSNE